VVEPIASDGLIEAEMIEIEDETKTQPICDAGVTFAKRRPCPSVKRRPDLTPRRHEEVTPLLFCWN